MSGNPPSRHLWVGGLPEEIGEVEIKELFTKYGKVEGVKILPQRYPNQGVAAFIDFYDVRSAVEAKEAKIVYGGCDLRTNFKTKSTERFDKYDHSSRREDYGKRGISPSPPPPPPPERGKERNSKDKEKSRGKESSSSSSSSSGSSGSSGSSSSDGSTSESEGGTTGKKSRKKSKTEIDTFFLKITNLANRPERVLQDGLYYEFTRYSPTAVVRMYGEGRDTSAVVKFDSKESCKKAFTEAQGLVLFGSKLKLSPVERDDFPNGGRDIQVVQSGAHKGYPPDEIDPQATHSLFVGNIPKNIGVYELRDIFHRFGDVVDVEIKKMSGNATYGFVLFYDLLSAVAAKQFMDGENIHGHNIRVGFGKGTPSKMLWVDGIDPDISESILERALGKYGKVVRLGVDRQRCSAMVQYESIEAAKEALSGVKGTFIGNGRRIMTDFANRDARAAFFARVESGDQVGPPRFPGPGMYGPGGMGPGPRGMMMPRPGVPMMGMGRGGFPPMAGPPMDMYYYNPYMGEGMGFYGGGPHFPRGPPMRGMRRIHPRERGGGALGGGAHFEETYDDYGDELRAFSRKREIEKEERKWKERRRHHSSSDSGGSDSEEGGASRRKKKTSRDKDKPRKSKKEKSKDDEKRKRGGASEVSSGEEEASRKEEARLKATQRSRDLREKLKKKNQKKDKEDSHSDSGNSGSEKEADLRKSVKKNRDKEKEKERDRGRKEQDMGRDKDPVKKEQDGKTKERKAKSSDKDRRREKGKEKEPERKARNQKLASEKQDTLSGDRARSSSRDPAKKRPQETKLRKSEATSEKRSRSNSESSKTPTTPPATASASRPSPPSKPTNPPRTPPTTPPTKTPSEYEGEEHHIRGDPGEEKMDTLPPLVLPCSPDLDGAPTLEDVSTLETGGPGLKEAAEPASVPDTPESPPAPPTSKKEQKLESDLSSGEEFPESTAGSPLSPRGTTAGGQGTGGPQSQAPVGKKSEKQHSGKKEEAEPVRFKMKLSSHNRLRAGVLSPTSGEWSPDHPSSQAHHHSPPPSHPHHSPPPSKAPTASHRSLPGPTAPGADGSAGIPASRLLGGEEQGEGSRKSRKLPRCYQLEEERLREKQREPREHRHTKQHPPPSTPSPPPAYVASSSSSLSQRRRHAHSPPPPSQQQAEFGERRWRQRGSRHFSPAHQFGSRRHSRSPPPPSGYPHSPLPSSHGGGGGGRSPYSSSPPPRPRTPIQRPPRDRGVGGPRHRYDSPPYDTPLRGKHGRRGSSPVRHFSPSPPPPLSSRPRSPGGRRHHQRRYSRSPSPPPPAVARRSPLRRKEPQRSPSPGSSRSSPRYQEDRLEPRKYGKKPAHAVYSSRSPSPPKSKRRDGVPPREEYPDPKRRRVEDSRGVKSPSSGGSLSVKEEVGKSSRPDKTQPSSYSVSDRHHGQGQGKESHQHRSQPGSAQGGVAHGGGSSHPSHHAASQGKMATSPSITTAAAGGGGGSVSSKPQLSQQQAQPPTDLMDLLRRYPVMWQGHLTLKNESAAVQLHFLSGNVQLAKSSLPGLGEGQSPALRIAQRMRLEPTQLEGVQRRIQNDSEHCLLLALPCGRDARDVRTQTDALKNSLISYLLQKQAAGIINVPGSQTGFVLHIFPPCQFSQTHLSRVAPDLLSSASDNCHLMIVVATM